MMNYTISIYIYSFPFLFYSIYPVLLLNSTLFITLDLLILGIFFMYLSIMFIIYITQSIIYFIYIRLVNSDLRLNHPFMFILLILIIIISIILFVFLLLIAIIIIYEHYIVLINGGGGGFNSNSPLNNSGYPNNSGPNPPNNNFDFNNSVSTVNFRDWEKDSYYPDSEGEY